NAIKFCHAKDRISIYAEYEQDMVRVTVHDTGRGISKEIMPNLFDLSHLSIKGTKDEIGMGLGLTLCKEFVELAGGKISATSEEWEGSCFEFTVPRFREEASLELASSNIPGAVRERATENKERQNRNLLLDTDHPVDRHSRDEKKK